jgi:outer membrane scaffolding protein for murein synthesis (MipA/OmpV family)
MKKLALSAAMLVASIGAPLMAQASTSQAQGDWHVGVGPFISIINQYSGSTDYKFFPLPYVDINWKNTVTFDTINGLGYDFYNDGKGTTVGVGLGYSLGRARNETALIKPDLTIGYYGTVKAFATYMAGPFEFNVSADRAVTHGYRYVTVNGGVNMFYPVNDNLILKFGPTIYWGDSEFMNGYYGVTASQLADNPELKLYSPSAGFEKVKLDLEAIVPFHQNWTFNPFVNYMYLFNEAANSAIVKTRNQYAVGFALVYKII